MNKALWSPQYLLRVQKAPETKKLENSCIEFYSELMNCCPPGKLVCYELSSQEQQ